MNSSAEHYVHFQTDIVHIVDIFCHIKDLSCASEKEETYFVLSLVRRYRQLNCKIQFYSEVTVNQITEHLEKEKNNIFLRLFKDDFQSQVSDTWPDSAQAQLVKCPPCCVLCDLR